MSTAIIGQPIDLAHLARYTGGEAALDAEVLNLFVQQGAHALARLHSLLAAPDSKTWRETLHTLKGSAMGVGAFAFAGEVASTETIDPQTAQTRAAAALHALGHSFRLVEAFVAAYLGE
ncbi:MAG: Hpt domain-containing protein [Rhizomicrobium sp.]